MSALSQLAHRAVGIQVAAVRATRRWRPPAGRPRCRRCPGARHEGAAAEATRAAVEAGDATLVGDQHVGDAEPARVVHVERERHHRGATACHCAQKHRSRTATGMGHADGVGDADLGGAAALLHSRPRSTTTWGWKPSPRTGTRKSFTDTATSTLQPAGARVGDDVPEVGEQLGHAAVHVAPVEGVGGADGEEDVADAVRERQPRPRPLGMRTPTAQPAGSPGPRRAARPRRRRVGAPTAAKRRMSPRRAARPPPAAPR